MIADQFSLAFKNLRRRKLRSSLTMIGIVISIATIFILVALSIGLQDAVEEQFRQLGSDKIFVQVRGQLGPPGSSSAAAELTIEDIEVIEKISGVKDMSYYSLANAKVEHKDEVRFTLVVGYPFPRDSVLIETGFYIPDEGRLLKTGDNGEVMIGSQYKYNNFLDRQLSAGDTITVADREFEVRTVLETVGNPQDDRLIYMDYDDFRPLFDIPDRIDFILVQVEDTNAINDIADSITRKLDKSRNVDEKNRDFSILTPEELLESFGQILNIITGFLFGVAAISLLVGAVGIANTMFTSVIERTKEIGVMKSIGAKNTDILALFTIEAGLLGLVGGILGVLLGIGIGQLIEYIAVKQLATTILQVSTPLWLVGASLAFAFVVGAVSGAWPAYQAANIKPVDALRYE